MCLVCVEWQAGRMTNAEAARALAEIIWSDASSDDDYDHAQEVAGDVGDALDLEADLDV